MIDWVIKLQISGITLPIFDHFKIEIRSLTVLEDDILWGKIGQNQGLNLYLHMMKLEVLLFPDPGGSMTSRKADEGCCCCSQPYHYSVMDRLEWVEKQNAWWGTSGDPSRCSRVSHPEQQQRRLCG